MAKPNLTYGVRPGAASQSHMSHQTQIHFWGMSWQHKLFWMANLTIIVQKFGLILSVRIFRPTGSPDQSEG